MDLRDPGRLALAPVCSTASCPPALFLSDLVVPQYRDGECEVRRLWDEAVAEAMGWDPEELTRLRLLLHREPHVRGLDYSQFGDGE